MAITAARARHRGTGQFLLEVLAVFAGWSSRFSRLFYRSIVYSRPIERLNVSTQPRRRDVHPVRTDVWPFDRSLPRLRYRSHASICLRTLRRAGHLLHERASVRVLGQREVPSRASGKEDVIYEQAHSLRQPPVRGSCVGRKGTQRRCSTWAARAPWLPSQNPSGANYAETSRFLRSLVGPLGPTLRR